MLVSCSSNQNAFFAQIDTLNSKGHKWQKLDKCRPAKKDALALPITGSNGEKLVCYTLVPAQTNGAVTTLVPAIDYIQTPSPNVTQKTTPDISANQPNDNLGIIWQFSNF